MKPTTVAAYAEIADRNFNQPWVYGGGSRLPSLAFAQRYNRDLKYDSIKDVDGMARWVTQKQMRVYGIIARISLSEDGFARMLDVANEAGCHTTTVSRTLLKLQAWGLYAVDVKRGRNGGIRVRRPWGEHAKAYVRAARQRLWELSKRTREKVASVLRGRTERVLHTSTDMDATFSRKPLTFADRVYYERAMLALEDPEGEYDAVHPLIGADMIEQALVRATDLRPVPVFGTLEGDLAILRERKMRDAALAGDWKEWERAKTAPAYAL